MVWTKGWSVECWWARRDFGTGIVELRGHGAAQSQLLWPGLSQPTLIVYSRQPSCSRFLILLLHPVRFARGNSFDAQGFCSHHLSADDSQLACNVYRNVNRPLEC